MGFLIYFPILTFLQHLPSYKKNIFGKRLNPHPMIQKYSTAFFFYKSVLRKVSFNAYLFEKELNKALSVLSKHEGTQLYRWAMSYNKNHPIFQAAF